MRAFAFLCVQASGVSNFPGCKIFAGRVSKIPDFPILYILILEARNSKISSFRSVKFSSFENLKFPNSHARAVSNSRIFKYSDI